MATEIFLADFDGIGPGFKQPNENERAFHFNSWSIGGAPILAGRWQLSYPEYHDLPNLTGGSGRYAAVHGSHEFIDTLVWMISPLIDVGKHENLNLSADLYFKSNGGSVGEDTLTISILTIDDNFTSANNEITVIGENMGPTSPVLQGHQSWPITISDTSHLIQLAFSWYSSMGPASVQLDNIRVTGEEIIAIVPPSNFKVQMS